MAKAVPVSAVVAVGGAMEWSSGSRGERPHKCVGRAGVGWGGVWREGAHRCVCRRIAQGRPGARWLPLFAAARPRQSLPAVLRCRLPPASPPPPLPCTVPPWYPLLPDLRRERRAREVPSALGRAAALHLARQQGRRLGRVLLGAERRLGVARPDRRWDRAGGQALKRQAPAGGGGHDG